MTNMEGITRKLLHKHKSIDEIRMHLVKQYQIFKDLPEPQLYDMANAIIEEVEKTEEIFNQIDISLENSSQNVVSAVLCPIESNVSMGEGGVGCRGEGDNFVHQLLGEMSQTSVHPVISPLSLDDTGAIQVDTSDGSKSTIIVTKMEGMHSRLSDFPFLAGFHVTRAMLRDIYVKGAVPLSIMVDVHLADDGDIGKLFDFQAGIATVAEISEVPITAGSTLRIGGDMVIGDRLTGGIAGIGLLKYPFFRENIRIGDSIIMTEGAGGGTISTTALYQGNMNVVEETLNFTFLDACRNILQQDRLCHNIHAMIDVTNGGLRNDLLEISMINQLGFHVQLENVKDLVNPKVMNLLTESHIDYLGVSLDSLVIFCEPVIADEIVGFLKSINILSHKIGQVIKKEELKFMDETGEMIMRPQFRESAYTKIKKEVDKIPENLEIQHRYLQRAFDQALSKKKNLVEYLQQNRNTL
ncbi:MAG: hypothetical protein E4G98_01810 [Promethearchaeota archaeon]|nr:MAG: hypothetical protein E4G98_01810 [Candidatus Lokiarchaeota archaeon]